MFARQSDDTRRPQSGLSAAVARRHDPPLGPEFAAMFFLGAALLIVADFNQLFSLNFAWVGGALVHRLRSSAARRR